MVDERGDPEPAGDGPTPGHLTRAAVISDVHANGPALGAVLADLHQQGVDELWTLGDTVGYGPQPNETTATIALHADLALVGNHDLVALGQAGVSVAEFNPDAAAAARWTQAVLTGASREFLSSLLPTDTRSGVALFHASAVDPVWDYVLTIEDARRTLELTDDPLVLVGHTHVPIAITGDGREARGAHAPGGHVVDLAGGRWLLNPGSVGQPRDGDPRAAYLLLDLAAGRAEFRRVEYPVERTQEQMRVAGLPPALAQRLAYGV
ncbi:MAG TPA: metallophosphoesterase family protein [Gaiellaceae bacterium]|nr:metallophosphoesterase family protein [Gaiellaceae bacterium]